MVLRILFITGLLLAAPLARASSLVQAPITDRYGLCVSLPREGADIRIYAPVDTIFAVLSGKGRPLVEFRIDTMPGVALRTAEKVAEARPGWSSGSFYFYGAVPGQGNVIVVRNAQSERYRNLFITVSHAASLPSWIDVPALERSISHCGKNATAEPSAPPETANGVGF